MILIRLINTATTTYFGGKNSRSEKLFSMLINLSMYNLFVQDFLSLIFSINNSHFSILKIFESLKHQMVWLDSYLCKNQLYSSCDCPVLKSFTVNYFLNIQKCEYLSQWALVTLQYLSFSDTHLVLGKKTQNNYYLIIFSQKKCIPYQRC